MMATRPLGRTGLAVSPLGLGCASIASLRTRASPREIDGLLRHALASGVSLFDTADVYGQGDSERMIARAVAGRRDSVVLCTKAGLTVGPLQPLIRLAKPFLRPFLQRAGAIDRTAGALRAGAEATDFTPARLRACLEGSLRRLGTDCVDVFLLHSPPLSALADGQLYDLLDGLREGGLARVCGVSCRSVADAEAVIATGRVGCVQIPLHAGALPGAAPFLAAAAAQGVGVIAREVFTGGPLARARASADPAAVLAAALRQVARADGVSSALVGVTRRAHLDAAVAALDEPC